MGASLILAQLTTAQESANFEKIRDVSPDGKFAEEKPDPLLAGAMKNMSNGVWSVNRTVISRKTIKLHGLLSGEDFDLAMEPGTKPGAPMRGIVIKDQAWVCSDGESWHAGTADDRLLYNWAHTPIMIDRQLPQFQKVGAEQRNGQTWLHVRLGSRETRRSKGVTAILVSARSPGTSSIHRAYKCRCFRKRVTK